VPVATVSSRQVGGVALTRGAPAAWLASAMQPAAAARRNRRERRDRRCIKLADMAATPMRKSFRCARQRSTRRIDVGAQPVEKKLDRRPRPRASVQQAITRGGRAGFPLAT